MVQGHHPAPPRTSGAASTPTPSAPRPAAPQGANGNAGRLTPVPSGATVAAESVTGLAADERAVPFRAPRWR